MRLHFHASAGFVKRRAANPEDESEVVSSALVDSLFAKARPLAAQF
jgi:hypothetical protein